MTPEAAAVLASPDHEAFGMGMFHRLPQTMAALRGAARELPHRARRATTTATGRRARSASSAASSRGTGPTCCPTSCRRWTASGQAAAPGARVADVGCGAGGAVLLLAGAFPASTFTGYDISQHALARADERLAERGPGERRRSHDPRDEPLPDRPLARPRHDVRLHPRHDRSAGDDARHPGRRCATTARGCSSTSRRSTRSRRTSPRTRWRR